jgi:RNA polymerase sigma factor (sigma-70 family)
VDGDRADRGGRIQEDPEEVIGVKDAIQKPDATRQPRDDRRPVTTDPKPAFLITKEEYGRHLRQLRRDWGLTADEMATKAGISQSSLYITENGVCNTTFRGKHKMLFKIAEALDDDRLRELAAKVLEQDDRIQMGIDHLDKYRGIRNRRYQPWTSVGTLAAQERLRRGMTQREVADRLGLSGQVVSDVERCAADVHGKHGVGGVDTSRDMIAAYYGYDTDELFDPRAAKRPGRRERLRARYGKLNAAERNTESLFEEENRPDDPEELLTLKRDHEALWFKCRGLAPRLQRVLWERYVLGYTLQEVGDRIGITRERVRQIEERAIMVLRHSMLRRMVDRIFYLTSEEDISETGPQETENGTA